MTVIDKSLLPAHLNEVERKIDGALSRIEDINIPIETLWDPWLCPIDALPYLAWSLSVDVWDNSWTEEVKRQTVANSVEIHRVKGTRPAVEKAVSVISGDEVKLIEWFEDPENHRRGEFSIETVSISQAVDIELLRSIIPLILSAKNARSHLKTVTVKTKTEVPVKLLTVSRQGLNARSGAWLISSLVSQADKKLSTVSRYTIHIRSGPWLFKLLTSQASAKQTSFSRQAVTVRSGAM